MINHSEQFVLSLSCPDRIGIVQTVSGFFAENGCNIIDSQQYMDPESERFFMRVQLEQTTSDPVDLDRLRVGFSVPARDFDMEWKLVGLDQRGRVLVMVSRFGHCLNDLLYRSRSGAFNGDVVAVVSNHRDFESMVTSQGIPFHHVPVDSSNKSLAEAQLLALVQEYDVDLVVLARYMQVLSDDLCGKLEGRAINIHHSFLPSFKGARPYHQAHLRGVKLIGATAHYVTASLDEGPIIEQEVARVDHRCEPDALVRLGRDVESVTLARAVEWHLDHRVVLNGSRTVVFR